MLLASVFPWTPQKGCTVSPLSKFPAPQRVVHLNAATFEPYIYYIKRAFRYALEILNRIQICCQVCFLCIMRPVKPFVSSMCICGNVSDATAPLERLLNSCICCACTIWQERDSRKEPSHQIGVIAWQCSLTRCYSINLKKMSRVALCWPSFSMKLSPWNRMFFFTRLSSKWKNKMLIFWLESGLFFSH